MILRSVVGKLWLTIIILVSLVLILLSLLLNEQVQKTYVKSQQANLARLAQDIQSSVKKSGDHTKYLNNVLKVSEMFHTYLVILDINGQVRKQVVSIPPTASIPWTEILTPAQLTQLSQGKTISGTAQIVSQDQNKSYFSIFKNDLIYVALPYERGNKADGYLVLYQTQDQLSQEAIKRWIFYSALIGIALTTIFAFFLSTRITQPLIQMKKAAEKMERGHFSTRVPVRSRERDEIAELAITFNRMAGQLEDSIQQLSQEKEQLFSILGSLSDGVLSLNKNGKILLTNPPADRFLLLFGYTHTDRSTPLPLPLQDFLNEVLRDEKSHAGDITEQGRTFAVLMTPLNANGQIRGVVTVLREVTKERRLDKLRKDFVANVSHELRTPLMMLQGYSEALMDDMAETAEERQMIAQVINEETQRMGRLVHDLLNLARIEAGNIVLTPKQLDVAEFMQRVMRKFHALARERQIQVGVEVKEEITTVYWDADRMEQVLTNLVDNALRHTPADGSVRIEVSRQEEQILVEVVDTGPGIPAENLPFLFDRFFKADKARTRGPSSGTGLGLSIVKHLVHAHKGTVSVRSEMGVGTVFAILLPERVEKEVVPVQ